MDVGGILLTKKNKSNKNNQTKLQRESMWLWIMLYNSVCYRPWIQ